MIKICGKSIYKISQLIFNQCIDTGSLPLESKKPNVVPVYKKGDKQCFEKLPTSLIASICRKVLQRLIFNPIQDESFRDC